jgi:hypothetical protein
MDDDQYRATGGSAFPTSGYGPGMTLLDHFAACALTGYLAAFTDDRPMPDAKRAALYCYDYADAMLAERLRRKGADSA